MPLAWNTKNFIISQGFRDECSLLLHLVHVRVLFVKEFFYNTFIFGVHVPSLQTNYTHEIILCMPHLTMKWATIYILKGKTFKTPGDA